MNTYVKAVAKTLLEEGITEESLLGALEICLEYGIALALFAPESSQEHIDQEARIHVAKDIMRRHVGKQVTPVSEELLNWLITLDQQGFPVAHLQPEGTYSN